MSATSDPLPTAPRTHRRDGWPGPSVARRPRPPAVPAPAAVRAVLVRGNRGARPRLAPYLYLHPVYAVPHTEGRVPRADRS